MPLEHHVLPAPYSAFSPLPGLEALSNSAPLPRGALVALRPARGTNGTEIEEAADRVWRTVSRATVILWLDLLDRPGAVEISGLAGAIGMRGLVVGDQPIPRVLRRQLTDPSRLAADCIAWLRRQGFDLSATIHRYVECGLTYRNWRNATELVAVAAGHFDGYPRDGERGTTVRERELRRFRADTKRCRLGTPGVLLQIVRMYGVANALQRRPGEPLSQMARDHGFHDERHLRRRIDDVFGCAPTDIRRWLGREWLLQVAFARAGVS